MRRNNKRKSGGSSGFHRYCRIGLFIFVLPIIAGVAMGTYISLVKGIPSVEELKNYQNLPSTKVYADDDSFLGEFRREKGVFLPYAQIPGQMVNAVVAVEDGMFWRHSGINYMAIARAALKDVLYRELKEGGSTITQQLAKITFLTPEKTIKRKLREAVLATRMEKELTKEEILELYLNRVYFGHGAYGIEMAARIYFDKSAKDLSVEECAVLAGTLKAPTAYSPYNNPERAKERQLYVLQRMQDEGFLASDEREFRSALSVTIRRRGNEVEDTFDYFLDMVRKTLEEKYGPEEILTREMKVYTTLNPKAQLAAQAAVQQGLRELEKRRGWRGPQEKKDIEEVVKYLKGEGAADPFPLSAPKEGDIVKGVVLKVLPKEAVVFVGRLPGRLAVENAEWAKFVNKGKGAAPVEIPAFDLTKILSPGDVVNVAVKSLSKGAMELSLEQMPEAQASLAAMDPATGYIRALVGGYDYSLSEYNRAINAKRQPGSSFKPIIYAAALDTGKFTPASVIVDTEVTFADEETGTWSPKNYDNKYKGPTRMRDALAYSRNVITVKLVNEVGVKRVIDYARGLGIQSEMPQDLSISLGSLSMTPLDLTACYGIFANGGIRVEPIAIKHITDERGRIIESNKSEGKRVMDQRVSYLMTSMLKDVVNYGTGWRAKALRRPVAGKTGTTNEYRDAWFVGYTPDMVAGVWVGFDDVKELGKAESGSRAAAPIWVSFMQEAVSGLEPRDFPIPDGIVSDYINPDTGLRVKGGAGGLLEYFISGTEPPFESADADIISKPPGEGGESVWVDTLMPGKEWDIIQTEKKKK